MDTQAHTRQLPAAMDACLATHSCPHRASAVLLRSIGVSYLRVYPVCLQLWRRSSARLSTCDRSTRQPRPHRQAASMRIMVEMDGAASPVSLEVNADESVGFLKCQLYSLSDIPPHLQQLLGLCVGGMEGVKDSATLSSLKVSDGHRIRVKRKAASRAQPIQQARNIEINLESTCSRSYAGSDALVQPGFSSGAHAVCSACAGTCHLPGSLQPRPSLAPFVCQCTNIDNHTCLYAPRVASGMDMLPAQAKQQLLTAYHQLAVQQNSALLQKGQSQFQQRIVAHVRAMVEYERQDWQQAARELIPSHTHTCTRGHVGHTLAY